MKLYGSSKISTGISRIFVLSDGKLNCLKSVLFEKLKE